MQLSETQERFVRRWGEMGTRDEIAGLSQDCLAVDCPPAGSRSLRDWAVSHAATLGKAYAGELARRR